LENGPVVHKILPGFFGGTDIRPADHFHERDTRAIHVNEAVAAAGTGLCTMEELRDIFFHVDALYPNAPRHPIDLDVQVPVMAYRNVKLRNLIALHEIRIRVILAVEFGLLGNAAVERKAGHDDFFDGLSVDYRQCARKSKANRANVAVRLCRLVVGRA
jgi:hypothetical protein